MNLFLSRGDITWFRALPWLMSLGLLVLPLGSALALCLRIAATSFGSSETMLEHALAKTAFSCGADKLYQAAK